jgi:hypothetical protein
MSENPDENLAKFGAEAATDNAAEGIEMTEGDVSPEEFAELLKAQQEGQFDDLKGHLE